MGDPRKITNKSQKPMHPWNKERLEREKPLMIEYGLASKSELWKISSALKVFKDNAKRLVALSGAQAQLEKNQMVNRLKSYGLIQTDSLDEILGLQPEHLLDRRLQTLVFKKNLARTVKQARQMITHKHITVNGKKVTAPGYLVRIDEEASINYYPGSTFSREDHPERPPKEQVPGKKEAAREAAKAQAKKSAESRERRSNKGAPRKKNKS